jgi:predicted nucleic acid-binding protein
LTYFLDTSALVKRYLAEPGSDRVRALFRLRRDVAVARIAFAELAAAVARQYREGAITEAARDAALDRIQGDFSRFTVVEVRPAILARVPALVVRWPLRGYDAVQLASAMALHAAGVAVDFWSTDRRLLEAAHGEGVRTTWVG